ncbi:MAG: hypothetical protein JWM80_1177 [Cyanobacteria bacterium RYN_339]|nr:hypothetical protein [Cyanobacteria bacterium RYN_339]
MKFHKPTLAKLTIIAGLALLSAGGCAVQAPPLGTLEVSSRASVPATVTPLPLPAGQPQRLRIQLDTPARARHVMDLPASWDVANVTFNSPTKLTAPSVIQIPFASFVQSAPPAPFIFTFTGDDLSDPVLPPLRPGTDYNLMADLETSSPLALEAYGIVPGAQTIDAGPNSFIITLKPTGNQGSEIPISTAAGNQTSPALAYDTNNDQQLVVWADAGSILAAMVDNLGNTVPGITVCASGTASAPTVAYNRTADAFMVAWADTRNGHSDIYYNTVSTGGAPGTEAPLDHTGGHTIAETQPNLVSAAGADRFLLSWVDNRNNATSGRDIFAYRIASSGALSALISVAVSAGVTDQLRPIGCYAATLDRFVVGFEDSGDLRFQRINAVDGAILDGAMGSSLTAATGTQDQLSLAFNNKDALVLAAWRDGRAAPTQVYYAVVDPAAGTLALPDTALTSGTATAGYPQAGFGVGHGDYAILFQDNRTAGQHDLFLRRFKLDGVTTYGEKTISIVAGNQRPTGLVFAATADQFMATWEDDRGPDTDVYGQFLR